MENILEENIAYRQHNPKESMYQESIDCIQYLQKSGKDLLSQITEVRLKLNKKAIEWLKNSKPLQELPILLQMQDLPINNIEFNQLMKSYNNSQNLKLMIEGNKKKITIEEYKKTVLVINEMVSKIKKQNLSPLEQIMYAYDIVRDRVYLEEKEGEGYETSRDLTSVLLGDKIVCVGYANILDKILKCLNIRSQMVHLSNQETGIGHMRDVVYVNDAKYEIKAIYFLDPTWDSKRDNEDIDFINDYTYFCRTNEEMDALTKRQERTYEYRSFGHFNKDTKKKVLKIANGKEPRIIPGAIVNSLNNISKLIDKKDLIDIYTQYNAQDFEKYSYVQVNIDKLNIKELLNKIDEYTTIFCKTPLTAETLFRLLMNVRKVESNDNPEKYPFTMEAIEKAMVKSSYEELWENIGIVNPIDIKLNRKLSYDDFKEISEQEGYEEMIEKENKSKQKVYKKNK